jgi:hypothetical protein
VYSKYIFHRITPLVAITAQELIVIKFGKNEHSLKAKERQIPACSLFNKERPGKAFVLTKL